MKSQQFKFNTLAEAMVEYNRIIKQTKENWAVIESGGSFYLENGEPFIRSWETVHKRNY